MLLNFNLTDDAGRHWNGTVELHQPPAARRFKAGDTVTWNDLASTDAANWRAHNSGTSTGNSGSPMSFSLNGGPPITATRIEATDVAAAAPAALGDDDAPASFLPHVITPGIAGDEPPAQLLRDFPGVRYVRVFVGPKVQNTPDDHEGLTRKIRNVCDPVWVAGGIPIVSIKLNVAQVIAGRWAGALHDLGAWAAAQTAAGHPLILVIWHEPEDDIPGPTFVQYHNIAYEQLHSGAHGQVPLMYVAMAYQWAPGYHRPSKNGHTDDPTIWAQVRADIYGVDVYSGRDFPLDTTLPNHPGFKRWKATMIDAHPGRVWMVVERGFEASPSNAHLRADTIVREALWLTRNATGCVGYVYWNSKGTEQSKLLPLDQLGEIALRDLFARLTAARSTSVSTR